MTKLYADDLFWQIRVKILQDTLTLVYQDAIILLQQFC